MGEESSSSTIEAARILAEAVQLHGNGRLAEAEAAYRRVIETDPSNAGAWHLLGIVAHQTGRSDVALALIDRAIAIDAGNAACHGNRAVILQTLGRLDEALAAYGAVIRLAPDHADAHNERGNILRALGRSDAALAAYDAAVRLKPDFAEAHNNRSAILKDLGRFDDALAACDTALGLRPDFAEAHNNRGTILENLDRFDDALAAYDQAAARPGPAEEKARINRSVALTEMGRKDEALATLDSVIRDHPRSARAWCNRSNLKIFAADDPDIAAMTALLDDGAIPTADRMALHFALGKAHLESGDDERAFHHLGEGNRLKRATITFDPKAVDSAMTAIAQVFSADFLAGAAEGGAESALPVFVLGMPRSGTTLVEQILASHPLIHGAGELPALPTIADSIAVYPWGVPGLGREDFARLGRTYLDRIEPLAGGARHVIDKTPANFLHAGLIRRILPNARIIHCQRDPADTCLSCYATLFASAHLFAYDQTELGAFYRSYQRLTDHWRSLLPAERFIEVEYEALVGDLEAQARRLVAFLGLPWDESCLRFHENRRVVRTASVTQVRRPLYTTSVGRWCRYAAHLGPLLDALGR